jgi:hypothetical protein
MSGKSWKGIYKKDCGMKEDTGDFSSINPHKQNADIRMKGRGRGTLNFCVTFITI